MLGRYAAPKQEISEIIANLFIELDYSVKLCEEHPDEIIISGTTYSGRKGVLRLLMDDIFLFEGEQEDIIRIREDNGKYEHYTR